MTALAVALFLAAVAVIVAAGLRLLFHDPGDRARPFAGPEIHHDEYPRTSPAPAPVTDLTIAGGSLHNAAAHATRRGDTGTGAPGALPSPLAPALAVLAALTAPVRAHLEQAERARAGAFRAEAMSVFPPWEPWPGDDTLARGMQVT